MENIYPPEKFNATEPIDFDQYFTEFQAECNLNNFPLDDAYKDRMRILREEFNVPFNLSDIKDLEALCTVDKLNVIKENNKLPLEELSKGNYIREVHPITEEAQSLYTVRSKEEFNARQAELQIELKCLKNWFENWKEGYNPATDVVPGSSFIQRILICIPFNTLLGNKLSSENIRIQYEIEVFGTNTLLDLANAIKCVSDLFIMGEVPDVHADLASFKNAKEQYPSRCFFIENTFYNDMSHPNAIDYSEVVRKWAAERNIGNFVSKSMEEMTFASLKPRLGYGYVYIHQGNCEHIICFSDARLAQHNDCLDLTKYPRVLSIKRDTNYLCFICLEKHSSWIVVNSDRLPVKKAFFCSKCCESYMYLDGKKIGDFQLYPYFISTLVADSLEERPEHDENEW